MHHAPFDDYRSLFRTRRDYLAALLELVQDQGALIATEDYGELLLLLGKKQRLLGRMEELQRTQATLWHAWRRQRNQLTPEERTICEDILTETARLLQDLTTHEEAAGQRLAARRDQMQHELVQLTSGARAASAYRDECHRAPTAHLDLGG